MIVSTCGMLIIHSVLAFLPILPRYPGKTWNVLRSQICTLLCSQVIPLSTSLGFLSISIGFSGQNPPNPTQNKTVFWNQHWMLLTIHKYTFHSNASIHTTLSAHTYIYTYTTHIHLHTSSVVQIHHKCHSFVSSSKNLALF